MQPHDEAFSEGACTPSNAGTKKVARENRVDAAQKKGRYWWGAKRFALIVKRNSCLSWCREIKDSYCYPESLQQPSSCTQPKALYFCHIYLFKITKSGAIILCRQLNRPRA